MSTRTSARYRPPRASPQEACAPVSPEDLIVQIDRMPADQRRCAFFKQLAELPLHSVERLTLKQLGRHRFARAPFTPAEFDILGGLTPSDAAVESGSQ